MPNYLVLVKNCRGRRIVEWFDTYADADFYCSDIESSEYIEIYERTYTEDGEQYEIIDRR